MTTYTVGLSPDKSTVHIADAGVLPAGYTSLGTFDHDAVSDPEDELGLHAPGHTMFHHVQEILGRKSWANPALAATFPDNITDMASIDIYKGWEAPPFRLTSPAISGTARVGFVLTCSNGTWTGPTATLARRWLANGVVIPGATAATYTAVVGDLGKTITCEVTPSNAFGTGPSFTTAATAAVIAA